MADDPGTAPPVPDVAPLRGVLAAAGLAACSVGLVLCAAVGLTWAAVAFAVVAGVCGLDLAAVLRRRRRG